eukprot:SAG11_NODE_46_length_20454_cov_11.499386_15_plen_554_part_00
MEIDAAGDDLSYEEELLKNPYSVPTWWGYLESKQGASPKTRNILYERALQRLPGSYKLWHNYLRERREQTRGRKHTDAAFTAVNDTFERALVFMYRMPRIWMHYCEFMTVQTHIITNTRRIFDRALQALPIMQHSHIWPLYIKFVRNCGVTDTALRVYRRYLKLQPDVVEEYVKFLLKAERYDEAAMQLAHAVNSEDFVSREGRSKHEIWLQLCDLLSKNPTAVSGIKAEAIIRAGIRKFTDETGKLWTSLAEYHTRLGAFEQTRDVFEEALCTVQTVRDFAIIYDAYTQFEENIVADMIDEEDEDKDDERELRMAYLEHLMERRPVLLSSVLLRQNPHNVPEWHKRIKLFSGKPQKMVMTYTEAVKTVDPQKASGKPHTLWCSFAQFYEKHGDLENARAIFEMAVKEPFKQIDDLASVWCEYAEVEIRARNVDRARELLQRATTQTMVRRGAADKIQDGPVQEKLHKSTKLWCFYVDMMESLETVKKTSAVYDRMLDLKVATPQVVLNYAHFLESHKYFEESFKAYEVCARPFPGLSCLGPNTTPARRCIDP